MANNLAQGAATYRIVVSGLVDDSWLDCFEKITVAHSGGESILLARIPDQAALRGLLARVWDMNMVLLSVTHLPEAPPAEE